MKRKVFLLILSGFLFWNCGRKESEEPVTVIVKPTFFQLPVGGEVQFSAEVFGTLDKAVEWNVSGSGSSITPSGRFRAPLTVTTQPAVITAKSLANPAVIGNGSVETTAVRNWLGETVKSDMDKLVIGGYTVQAGQTIDLNGDNNLDLIALSRAENRATFFLGHGLGTGQFDSVDIPITNPVAAAVADFITEDTDEFAADAAIACADSCGTGLPSIVLIQGKTQENFSVSPIDHGLVLPPGKIPVLLAAGRFHGSAEARNSDLVVGTEDGSILLFLQERTPPVNFSPAPLIAVGGKPVQFEVADFNQDTFLDLAVVRELFGDVLILLGDGSGAFPSQKSVPMPAQPVSIGVGDFNGDEIPDLAAAFSTLKTVSFSIGNGDGTFQEPTSIALPSEPRSVVVEDVNLDRIVGTDRIEGNPRHDIAVALQNEILVFFGDGEGKLIGEWRFTTGVAPLSLRAGFFAGLGSTQGFQIVSLVYINRNENKFYLLNNANF